MRRTVIWAPLALSMSVASAPALALSWSSPWLTPEQRAQQLLDSGRPQDAAGLFRDPRRRAYAELKAGHYAEAAQLLRTFRDEASEYNRGNALARSGDLPSALAAYDAALQQAPGDRDARHNRDLVARELEQQSSQSSGKGGSQHQSGAGQRSGNGGQSQGAQSKGSSSGAQGQSGAQSGAQPGSPGSAQAGSSPADSSAAAGREGSEARQDAELAAQLQRNSARRGSQSSVGGTGSARGSESSGADIAARGKAGNAHAEADLPPPKSEQTLALEQWLRRIPDDPGGLLRRKFLIEHIERQQAEQGQGQGQDQSEDTGP